MQLETIAQRVRHLFSGGKPAVAANLREETAVDRVLSSLVAASDPDLLLQLVGIARHELRRLETDDEVWGALETRRDACINTPWRLEPGTGRVVDFFYDELRAFGAAIMEAAWQAVPYGYSVAECVYREDGGLVRLAKVEEKPLEWFRPLNAGELRFLDRSVNSAEGVPVDTELKFLLTRHRASYRQPHGEALLSRVYWPWYFRHNGWRFWAQFMERFGTPIILGKVANPKEFVKLMQEAGVDSVLAVDKTSDVQAVSVRGQGDFARYEAACCRRIQKAILGQTLTTDASGSGSYALGRVHELVRQDRRLADVQLVSATVQRWIDAATALNFPGRQPPRFVMADGRGLSPERAKRDKDLAEAGIVQFTTQYLHRAYDFEPGDVVAPGEKAAAILARFHGEALKLQAALEGSQTPPQRVAPPSVGVTASGGIRLTEGFGVQLRGGVDEGTPQAPRVPHTVARGRRTRSRLGI